MDDQLPILVIVGDYIDITYQQNSQTTACQQCTENNISVVCILLSHGESKDSARTSHESTAFHNLHVSGERGSHTL